MVVAAQRSLNLTLELQSTNQQDSSIEINVTNLPSNCFYRQTPGEVCKDFPANASDLVQVTVWTMKMLQKCEIQIPAPSYTSNLAVQGAPSTQAIASAGGAGVGTGLDVGLDIGLGGPGLAGGLGVRPGVGLVTGGGQNPGAGVVGHNGGLSPAAGVAGSMGGIGGGVSPAAGVAGSMGGIGGGLSPSAGVAGSLGGYNSAGGPLAALMMPIVAGNPQNPFNTALGLVGSTVGPQGITITPATIASILSLVNQVVNLAMSVAPVGGAAAGPIGTMLTAMMG